MEENMTLQNIEEHGAPLIFGFLGAFIATLITWAIIGGSRGTTYSRDFEAACASVGGEVLRPTGAGGDACYRVTLEQIPMPNVRSRQ
jgi:hypothetical protein